MFKIIYKHILNNMPLLKKKDYSYHYNLQSTISILLEDRYLFILENGLDQKNHLLALNGEGWGDFIIRCLDLSIRLSLL